MDPDARLGASKLCPSEYGHAQVDGSGVDGIEPAVQLKLLSDASRDSSAPQLNNSCEKSSNNI